MATVQLTYFKPDGSFHKSIFFKADRQRFRDIVEEIKSPQNKHLFLETDGENFTILVRGYGSQDSALLTFPPHRP